MVSLTQVAETWSSIYSSSWVLRSCLNFAHIGGLVGAGGCAIAADRATIIASRHSGAGVGHARRHPSRRVDTTPRSRSIARTAWLLASAT